MWVKDFLKSQDWQFTQVEGKNILIFGIGGTNGSFQCIVDLMEADKRLDFYSVCAANTPANKSQAMLQLINGLNYRLFFGNFEMDLQEGEIRLRTSISFKHIELNEKFIEELVMSNIITMDKSLPAIVGLMYKDYSVDKALEIFNQD